MAARLREAADLLESKPDANPYRVRAYRQAAATIAALEQPVRDIFEDREPDGLDALPGIGRGIAAAVAELLITGDWSLLRRLKGDVDPRQILQTVPGTGLDLARQTHDRLQVDTLEALEVACAGGRLPEAPGIGARLGFALRSQRCATAAEWRLVHGRRGSHCRPPVSAVLDVDREFRNKSAERKLPTIAPRRYNPTGEGWLPIVHTHREGNFPQAFAAAMEGGFDTPSAVVTARNHWHEMRHSNGSWERASRIRQGSVDRRAGACRTRATCGRCGCALWARRAKHRAIRSIRCTASRT